MVNSSLLSSTGELFDAVSHFMFYFQYGN